MPRLSWACARCDRRGHLASQLAAISPASPRRQYYAKPRAATEPDDAGPKLARDFSNLIERLSERNIREPTAAAQTAQKWAS